MLKSSPGVAWQDWWHNLPLLQTFSIFFLYSWKLFLFIMNLWVKNWYHRCYQNITWNHFETLKTSTTSLKSPSLKPWNPPCHKKARLYGYNAGFLDLFGRTVDLDGFPEAGPRPRSKDAQPWGDDWTTFTLMGKSIIYISISVCILHLSHVCTYNTVLYVHIQYPKKQYIWVGNMISKHFNCALEMSISFYTVALSLQMDFTHMKSKIARQFVFNK